jgi:propanediol dehydratase small subunit
MNKLGIMNITALLRSGRENKETILEIAERVP